jgi:hypothetical protein
MKREELLKKAEALLFKAFELNLDIIQMLYFDSPADFEEAYKKEEYQYQKVRKELRNLTTNQLRLVVENLKILNGSPDYEIGIFLAKKGLSLKDNPALFERVKYVKEGGEKIGDAYLSLQ